MAGRTICEVSIKRVPRGVEVWIKSEMLEKHMRSIAETDEKGNPRTYDLRHDSENPTIKCHKHYVVEDDYSLTNQLRTLGCDQFIIEGQRANLLPLKIVGIKDGITLRYPIPMSRSMIISSGELLKERLAMLLSEYAGPAEAHVTITEKDTHA